MQFIRSTTIFPGQRFSLLFGVGLLSSLIACKGDISNSSGSGGSTDSAGGIQELSANEQNKGGMYMRHYNLARTGVNPAESILTLANVQPGSFGLLQSFPTDGYSYTQPLYAPNVMVRSAAPIQPLREAALPAPVYGGNVTDTPTSHNVLYVATENDTLYAFDADGTTSEYLWKVSYQINGETNLSSKLDTKCPDIGPKIGITGTPVIDPTTNTLYLVATTKNSTSSPTVQYFQRLHAVDLATGLDKLPPKLISNQDFPDFDPLLSNQRPALVLNNGKIYVGYSSNCDQGPYTGMILTFSAKTLAPLYFGESAHMPLANDPYANPNGGQAGIWSSGMGPAVDEEGNLYTGTGNGNWDGVLNPTPGSGQGNFGCSVLKFSDSGKSLTTTDFFTPFNFQAMNTMSIDLDVGSGGITLLPKLPGAVDSYGNPLRLLVSVGKSGQVYLINRNNMGHVLPSAAANGNGLGAGIPDSIVGTISPTNLPVFQPGVSFSNIVQSWNLNGSAYGMDGLDQVHIGYGMFGTPVFFDNRLYFGAVGDNVKAYQINANGTFTTDATGAVQPVDQTYFTFGFPGVTPSLSANVAADGSYKDAILWVVDDTFANNPAPPFEAVLVAYDAKHLANGPLYNSDQSGNLNDKAGPANKYSSPTIANGKVYFATKTGVYMYGLTGNPPSGSGNIPDAPLPTSTTSGVNLSVVYDPNGLATNPDYGTDPVTSPLQACPGFTLAAFYNFEVAPCGNSSDPSATCETTTAVSGGVKSGEYYPISVPVNTDGTIPPVQLGLPPGSYQIVPGTNTAPWATLDNSAGTDLLYIEPPFNFIVQANGYTNFQGKIYCGLANGNILALPTPGSAPIIVPVTPK